MSEEAPAIPEGIKPFYFSEQPNAPIELYSGPVDLHTKKGKDCRLAKISLQWSPSVMLMAEMEAGAGDLAWFASDDLDDSARIEIPDIEAAMDVDIPAGNQWTLSLDVYEVECKPECSQLTFQVVNFIEYFGAPISFQENSRRRGRMEFVTDEWHIMLDVVPNSREIYRKLRDEGGYAITHTGRLQHTGGSDFLVKDGLEVINALRCFLAFCRGRFVGVPFIRGVDDKGNRAHETWCSSVVNPWNTVLSWFPKQQIGDVEKIFGRFLTIYSDPDWCDTLTYAIHWYVNANVNVAALEGSIVLAQIALERLSWMVMAVDKQAISQNGFDKLCAADKLNLLFNELNIPKELPSGFSNLTAYCSRNNISCLAESIAHFRNAVVHPPRKSRTSPGHDVKVEVWRATLWCLELSILALLKYKGCYFNRINPELKSAGQYELLPWNQTDDGEGK